jgi:hypothetical protein
MPKWVRDALGWLAGESVKEFIAFVVAVGAGTALTAWLAGPVILHLTHLQVVAAAFVLLVLLGAVAWASRALTLRRRPKFHLTQHGHRNIWGTPEQKDGSINTSIAVELVAKNLTSEPVYLVIPRLVRPKIDGEVVMRNVHLAGGDHAVLPPREPAHISVFLHIRGTLVRAPTSGRIAAVIAIADDEGHEQRVHVNLRWLQRPPKSPAQTPSTSPA